MAADFFTIEGWTRSGLTRVILLFPMELSTRRVTIAGMAAQPDGIWMDQVARNLCHPAEGFLTWKRYLIHNRDPLFTAEVLGRLAASGVKSVKLPPQGVSRAFVSLHNVDHPLLLLDPTSEEAFPICCRKPSCIDHEIPES